MKQFCPTRNQTGGIGPPHLPKHLKRVSSSLADAVARDSVMGRGLGVAHVHFAEPTQDAASRKFSIAGTILAAAIAARRATSSTTASPRASSSALQAGYGAREKTDYKLPQKHV